MFHLFTEHSILCPGLNEQAVLAGDLLALVSGLFVWFYYQLARVLSTVYSQTICVNYYYNYVI